MASALAPGEGGFLSLAEHKLIKCALKGERWTPLSDGSQPDCAVIRPSVIKCLLTNAPWSDGINPWPVHPRGVMIVGGTIPGNLDLAGCEVLHRLMMNSCVLDGDVLLTDATTKGIFFQRTSVKRIDAQRTKIDGNFHFRNRCHSSRGINMSGADISGNLSLRESFLGDQNGFSLNCVTAKIGRNVILSGGFEAVGDVRFTGTRIGGDLDCEGGKFWVGDEYALDCTGANIKGDVFLIGGFRSIGAIGFMAARVGGQLVINSAEILLDVFYLDPPSASERPPYVLDVESAHFQDVFLRSGLNAEGPINFWGTKILGDLRIDGAKVSSRHGSSLNLRALHIGSEFFISGETYLIGDLDLRQAEARIFTDSISARIEGNIWLDGFTYTRFHDCATDAGSRIAWLKRQPSVHLDSSFRPQPWSQVIRVLREIGHDEDARQIAIAREDLLSARSGNTRLQKAWSGFLRFSVGYGYRPWRAALLSLAVIFCLSGVFAGANGLGYMAPRDGDVLTAMALDRNFPLPDQYPKFNPFIYALDVYLPVVELGQDDAWVPVTISHQSVVIGVGCGCVEFFFQLVNSSFQIGIHRLLYWLGVLLGWTYVSLFIAGMSGIMKSE